MLYKRKGLYKESVDLYVEVLVQHSAHKLIHTLFDVTFNVNDHNTANKHIIEFNNLLQQVVKICEKHGGHLSEVLCEDLWLHTIQQIFGIKERVKTIMKKGADLDSSSEEEQTEEKENFEKFLASKNQYFMQRMSEYVNLRKIIQFLEEMGHVMQYKEFKKTFTDKVKIESYFENILRGAMDLIKKDRQHEQRALHELSTRGIACLDGKCAYCKGPLSSRVDREEIWFLNCGHVFHARCIAKNDGRCSVCFDELEAFCKYLLSL